MVDSLDVGQGGEGERPYETLRRLERLYLENAAGAPQRAGPPETWAGVLYLAGRTPFLAALTDIEEVLDVPQDIARVPGARPWVCGVAHNHGSLLPIFDLQSFLFDVSTPRDRVNRVLVVRRKASPYGLLVSCVVGVRHFDVSTYAPRAREEVENGGIGPGTDRRFQPLQTPGNEGDGDLHSSVSPGGDSVRGPLPCPAEVSGEGVGELLNGSFGRGNDRYPVLSLHKLVSCARFNMAAVC